MESSELEFGIFPRSPRVEIYDFRNIKFSIAFTTMNSIISEVYRNRLSLFSCTSSCELFMCECVHMYIILQ